MTIREESHHNEKSYSKNSKFKESFYNKEMEKIQIELVKLQNWLKNTICKTTI